MRTAYRTPPLRDRATKKLLYGWCMVSNDVGKSNVSIHYVPVSVCKHALRYGYLDSTRPTKYVRRPNPPQPIVLGTDGNNKQDVLSRTTSSASQALRKSRGNTHKYPRDVAVAAAPPTSGDRGSRCRWLSTCRLGPHRATHAGPRRAVVAQVPAGQVVSVFFYNSSCLDECFSG